MNYAKNLITFTRGVGVFPRGYNYIFFGGFMHIRVYYLLLNKRVDRNKQAGREYFQNLMASRLEEMRGDKNFLKKQGGKLQSRY